MSKQKLSFRPKWSILCPLPPLCSNDKSKHKETTTKPNGNSIDIQLDDNKSVEDMEAYLHNPGYAYSSDMHTQNEKQGSSEGSKKTVSQVDLIGGLSKQKAHLYKLNAAFVEPSDLVLNRSYRSTLQTLSSSARLTEELYVWMRPVITVEHCEVANQRDFPPLFVGTTTPTTTTNSPHDLPASDTKHSSHTDSMDSSGEYVKFSKEGFWLEVPSEKLRKELEEELKLSGSNLNSHAWYHGRIPWEVSETLVVQHGDFLIRDSLSKPGGYVLTSHWNDITLHFPIIKALVQSSESYSRMQYTLEGDAFNSIPSLVHFYIGNRTALTQQSGAQIHNPVNRMLPLRYLEENFALAGSKCCVVSSPSCQRGKGAQTGGERGENHPASPAAIQQKREVRNHDLILEQNQPLTPVRDSSLSPSNNTTSPPRSPCSSSVDRVASSQFLSRHPSETPHHPCRGNSQLQQTKSTEAPLTHNLFPIDLEGCSYTALPPGSSAMLQQSYVERLCAGKESGIDPGKEEHVEMHCAPVVERVSIFRPTRYQSPLMPKENKPLEVGILQTVKKLLAEVDVRTAAEHITKADCMVARILDVSPEVQKRMGVSSGMELLTLPHGSQLRLDLLERFQTMAIMLAVDILGCTGTNEERAAMLNKTIQIAAELRFSLGNMFGFATIMTALELPQISRLEQTWIMLRQRHTEGAILYEKTLKPFMKRLNDGKESYPLSNTSFPHVVPLLCLLEKTVAVSEGVEPWETVEAGVDVVMRHLGSARSIAQLGGIYCSNAKTKLHGFQEQPEVLEIFLTDFQMRLLWGSRGAGEIQGQRYAKFEQVLTVLSNKLEPSVRPP